MKRSEKRSASIYWLPSLLSVVVFSLFMIGTLQAEERQSSSGKSAFSSDKLLSLMANGIYDVKNPDFALPDYQFFVSKIMQWSDQEIADYKQQATTFFKEKFGVDVADPKYAGRVIIAPFMLDPRWEYRVYQSSGENLPNSGWVVRDGGFMLVAIDPGGIELGGEFASRHVAQGSVAVFGEYNIKISPLKNLVMHYQSREPVLQNNGFPLTINDKGVLIAPLDIFHEKYGHAFGFAHIWHIAQEGGRVQTNIRNIINFPAGSAFPEEIKNYNDFY